MARELVIMGAAGRDFHNFNVLFRSNPDVQVVAFTATQIPDIAGRCYPPALSGPRYPEGIPILAESELAGLLEDHAEPALVAALEATTGASTALRMAWATAS